MALLFLASYAVLWYTIPIKTYDNKPLFTEEQLLNMKPEYLREIVRLQKQYIEKMDAKIKLLQETIKLKQEQIIELEFMNAMLNDQLTLAQKQRFGALSEMYEMAMSSSLFLMKQKIRLTDRFWMNPNTKRFIWPLTSAKILWVRKNRIFVLSPY